MNNMFDIGELIALPDGLVELRHDIVHGEMPELRMLQQATMVGLQWLREVFWKDVFDLPQGMEPFSVDDEQLRSELRAAFKAYLSARKEEVKKGSKEKLTAATGNTTAVCRRLCGRDLKKWQHIIAVILDDRMIAPAKRR